MLLLLLLLLLKRRARLLLLLDLGEAGPHLTDGPDEPGHGALPHVLLDELLDTGLHVLPHDHGLGIVLLDEVEGAHGVLGDVEDLAVFGLFELRQDKVGLHFEDGILRNLFAHLLSPELDATLVLDVVRHDDDHLALEAGKVPDLPLPRRRIHVRLINNVVPPPLASHFDQVVEALRALLDQHLEPLAVVGLPLQAHDLHLVDERIRPQDVVLLVGVLLDVVGGPGGLAGSGQADHDDQLALLAGRRRHRSTDEAVLDVDLSYRHKTRNLGAHRPRHLAKVHGEVLVLRHDVRVQRLALELLMGHPIGDPHLEPVDRVQNHGRVDREILN